MKKYGHIINLRISPELYEPLKKKSEETMIPIMVLIRIALKKYIETEIDKQ